MPAKFLVSGLLILLTAAALAPVDVTRVYNSPKQEAQYIRRIYEEHTVGQSFAHDYYAIKALDILARAEKHVATTLIAQDEQGRELSRAAIQATAQDQWFRLRFEPSVPKGAHTIVFTTEPRLKREEALLIRFQPQSDPYSDGAMVVDGQTSYGDIAFRAIEQVPLGRAVLIWGQVNGTSTQRAMRYAASGAAVAAIVTGATRLKPKQWPAASVWIPIALVVGVALAVRVPYLTTIEGVFGGDAINYLSKANALLQGHDPFAADPRKGPFYSLLLLPGFLTPDPLLWSRWVGIAAAAAATGVLPLLARRAGVPWALAVMSGLLLAVNQEFIWESPSGLAMTLFTLLIVLSVYAYLQAGTSRKWLWVLSVCVGLVMLTRFEGALVGAILLPAAWLRYRIPWKQMLPPLLVAGVLMAIPLTSFIWSGSSGIRTPADIAGDEGLFLVRSIWDIQLWHNIERSYEFFTNLWVWHGHNILVGAWMGLGTLVGGALALLKQKAPAAARAVLPAIATALAAAFLLLLMVNDEINREILVVALAVLAGMGIAGWLRRQPVDAAVILLTILVQVAVIIWILPKGRYFLSTVPFLSLALVYGLALLIPTGGLRRQAIPLFLLGCASIFFYVDGRATLEARLPKYNEQAHDTAVMLKAVRDVRGEGARVGIHPTGDMPPLLYIPPQRRVEFKSDPETNNALGELRWIESNTIQRLVERNREPRWSSVQEYPELFSAVKTFDSRYGDSRVFIYTVDRAKLAEFLQ